MPHQDVRRRALNRNHLPGSRAESETPVDVNVSPEASIDRFQGREDVAGQKTGSALVGQTASPNAPP